MAIFVRYYYFEQVNIALATTDEIDAYEAKDVVPMQYALNQNYPTPFNLSTLIR